MMLGNSRWQSSYQQVAELILATEKHSLAGTSHPDAALFLDAELSILGAPEQQYDEYAAAIRRDTVTYLTMHSGESSSTP